MMCCTLPATAVAADEFPLLAPVNVDSLIVDAGGDVTLGYAKAVIAYQGLLTKLVFRQATTDSLHAWELEQRDEFWGRELERQGALHEIQIRQKDWEIEELRGAWWERAWEAVDEWAVGGLIAWLLGR